MPTYRGVPRRDFCRGAVQAGGLLSAAALSGRHCHSTAHVSLQQRVWLTSLSCHLLHHCAAAKPPGRLCEGARQGAGDATGGPGDGGRPGPHHKGARGVLMLGLTLLRASGPPCWHPLPPLSALCRQGQRFLADPLQPRWTWQSCSPWRLGPPPPPGFQGLRAGARHWRIGGGRRQPHRSA
jgi:hypothetical protein